MSWKDNIEFQVQRDAENEYEFHLSWDVVEVDLDSKAATGYVDSLVKYAIYRVDREPDLSNERIFSSCWCSGYY